MRKNNWTRVAGLLAVLAMIGTLGFTPASSASTTAPAVVDVEQSGPPQDWFARYDGIEGDALDADHKGWIDVLAMDWGANDGADEGKGATRRRAVAEVEEMVLTFDYGKASPKLLEAMLTGKVVPKLEIEIDALGVEDGGTTYLRYELTNVIVTSYDVGGAAADGSPLVTTTNSFEEVRVTYFDRDERGGPRGTVETGYNVRTGSPT